MPGTTIGKSLTFGYPGQIARNSGHIVRTHPVKQGAGNIYFGDPVIIDTDGYAVKMGAGAAANDFAGVLARRVQQATIYPDQSAVSCAPGDAADVMEIGAITVECHVGAPKVGGAVYVRIAYNAAVPAGVVGGFEAMADGANTVQLTNCKWGTGADADGVAELVILTRQGV